jgi:phosphohistidine swiveling domain-containing protein
MRSRRALATLACLLVLLALAGCGGGSDDSTGSSSTAAESRPAPSKAAFPSAHGKTLAEVLEAADGPSSLVVSPAAQVFYKGQSRYPFGVFERDRTQVSDADVALYFAPVPGKKAKAGDKFGAAAGSTSATKAEERALDEQAVGPFPARIESMQTQPAFQAQTTTSDPDAATVVYVTDIDFPTDGEWRIAALIKKDDELTSTLLPSAVVGRYEKIPQVGQKAPLIHTPTPVDVGGDLSKVTTRIPPDTQNKVDYADALGKEPIVLLFATPQFCQSRVCGPVVDVAEQVKQLYGDKVAFIHMEIYKDNDPSNAVRSQVSAFHLPTEPWLFAIGRDGRITAEIEGAFGVDELTHVVKGLTGE